MRCFGKDTRSPFAVRRRDLLLGTAAIVLMAPAALAQTAGSQRARPNGAAPVYPSTPIPAPASLGQGKDRALVLGGGGEYFIAWLLGFVRGLRSAGVSYDLADIIVGTSAGAIVGSTIAADHLGLLRDDLDFFGCFRNSWQIWSQLARRTRASCAPATWPKPPTTPASAPSSRSAGPPWRLTIRRFAISS